MVENEGLSTKLRTGSIMKRLSLLFLFASQLFAQNWPSFRGQGGVGIAEGSKLPVSWDVEKMTNIRWKTPIPGLAHSSPIIWGDRIFVTTAIASEQNPVLKVGHVSALEPANDMSRQSYRLYCLNRATGKVLWERVVQEAEPRVKRHPKTTHASATPVTNGEYVVALFASGGLYCYDFKGNKVWSQDLGVLNANWGDKPEVQWGPASSPIIYRNLVIVLCDVEKDPRVVAFDVKTGKQAWTAARKTISSWSTPTVVETTKGPELVINGSEDARGYDPLTGRELWELRPTSRISIPTPFAALDLIYVASGYQRGNTPIYAIHPGAKGDISLKEGSSNSEQVAWSTLKGAPYISTPIVYGEYFYVSGYNGIFACYNARTGERVYEQRLGQGGFFSSSPVAGDGKIYTISEDGDAYVIKPGPNFGLLGTNTMGEVTMATPAIADGMIVIRTLSKIIAISAK